MADDGVANLGHGLAQLELPGGEEGLFGAGRALGTVQPLVATAQAGVAQRAVAAAVAGKLVEHVAHPGRLLVDVHLPGIAEVLAGQLAPQTESAAVRSPSTGLRGGRQAHRRQGSTTAHSWPL